MSIRNGRAFPSRRGLILLPVAGVICGLTLSSSCRGGARWEGKIEEINGISVATNPAEPMYPAAALTLTEELSIGREDAGDEYVFSDITGLDADDEGRIYVINRPDANVRAFDGDGRFLKTFGRKGQGPGEMEMPFFVQAGAGGEIFVFDYTGQRGLFFGPDGAYLRQQVCLRTFLPIRRNSRGQVVGTEVLAPPPLGGKVIRAYGPDLQPLFEIAREEQGSRTVFDIGKPAVFCAVRPDDSIVWGDSKDYVLHILDPGGRRIGRITKPYDRVPISDADRAAASERYAGAVRHGMRVEFRSHFPAFGGIFTDDAGRTLVKTYERSGPEKDAFLFDVFDRAGRFCAKVPIRANLDRNSVWKKGRLYTQETDPGGFPVVKRYHASWGGGLR